MLNTRRSWRLFGRKSIVFTQLFLLFQKTGGIERSGYFATRTPRPAFTGSSAAPRQFSETQDGEAENRFENGQL
jgi:hypothetical protein